MREFRHLGLAPTGVEDLRDITGIEKVDVPAESGLAVWLWWFFGLTGTALLFAGWKWWRRVARQPPLIALESRALGDLDRLEQAAHELDAARFHTELGDIVRSYVEQRFQVPAFQQTMPEFLRSMRQSAGLTNEKKKTFATIMERCDLAKFARAGFSPAENRESAKLLRDVLRSCGDEIRVTLQNERGSIMM